MADPFSIAVSAISLAAVFKEVVELAQNLDDSFRKISRNKKSKDRISALTLDSLLKLEEFYRKHAHVLHDAREPREALVDLKREMEYVHEKAASFITVPSKGLLRRVKPIFNAWMNRDKVEAELMQLSRHIQDCHMKFSTFAVLRIDITSHQILASTTRLEASNATIEQQLLVLKDATHVRGPRQRKESTRTPIRVTTSGQCSIVAPAVRAADSADLLSQVSEYVLAEAYLRCKVGTIDRALTELARAQIFPAEKPIKIYTEPFDTATIPKVLLSNRVRYQDTVISRALSISEVLQKHHISLSIQEGALDMLTLSIELSRLDMVDEALTVSRWTAELFRTMVNAGPTIYQPYFCMALLNLADDQLIVGDITDAASTISVCVELGRQQCIVFGTPAVKDLFACILTKSAAISQRVNAYEKAFIDASEAVTILENIFKDVSDWEGFDTLSPLSAHFVESCDVEEGQKQSQTLPTITCEPAPMAWISGIGSYLFDYGCALHELSWAHNLIGRFREAAKVGIRALRVFQGLHPFYPRNILSRLAATNLYLSSSQFRQTIPLERAAAYAEQATHLFHDLCNENPESAAIDFYCALEAYAAILVEQHQYDKALEVSQEMARVAEEKMRSQHMLADALREVSSNLRLLERRDEAFTVQVQSVSTYRMMFKSTSKHDGEAVYLLSRQLHTAGWYQEAIEAAREAILQYRFLALEGGSEEVGGLANALSWLAVCFDSVEDYTQASHERHEALRLLEDCGFTDPTILTSYSSTLTDGINSAYQSNDEDKSLPQSRDYIEKYVRLHASYPEQTITHLLQSFFVHENKLIKHNHTFAALRWIDEEVIPWFRAQPTPLSIQLSAAYVTMQVIFVAKLMHAGQMHEALKISADLIELWKSQPVGHDPDTLRWAFCNLIKVLLSLGRYEEAVESVHETLTRARANPPGMDLASSLAAAAGAMSHVGMHEEALAFAEESIEICQKVPVEVQNLDTRTWTFFCLRGLADRLADTGNEMKALAIAREAYQLAIEEKASETYRGNFQHLIGPCHFILAVCLFTADDRHSGLHHLQELAAEQRENIKACPGSYPLYAKTLHTLSWCYCALGLHEEGVRERSKFGSMMKRLGMIHPEIAELVRVELVAEAKRLSQNRLWGKIDLQCGHQHFEGVVG